MAFSGAKFLFYMISINVCLISTTILFMISYSMFIDPSNPKATGYTVALLVGSIILGIVIAVFTYKFTQKLAIPIVSAMAGGFLFVIIYNVTSIQNYWALLGFLVLGGIVGLFIGFKVQYAVKTVGTALMGAFIFIYGVQSYGASVIKDNGEYNNNVALAYAGGLIVVWIAGAVVQWKMFRETEEEDAFKDEDEAKCCGCF